LKQLFSKEAVRPGLIAVVAAALIALGTAGSAAAATPAPFFNGFETDTNGWEGDITRVASGTNGISSASGSFHAEADDSSVFTRWGGYTDEFPANGYTTELDIYLDPASGGTNDTRFDWTSAVSTPATTHRRDFVFNGGYYNDATGPGAGQRFVFSASNNAGRGNSFPKNPARNPIAITDAGWYTFQHVFYDNGSGVLAVDLSILDADGTVVGTWTLSDPTDVIGSTVGGNRYGWFATNEFDFLAIDNSRLDVAVGPPTSKDQCKKGGWEQFNTPRTFKNQGDCVSFVQTGK
jgi:hypothetical protein